MFEIICFGDAFLDHIVYLPVNTYEIEDGKICFDLGKKKLVEAFEDHLGGNAPNTAAGLKLLGLNTALAGFWGTDNYGKLIEKTLKEQGIDCTLSQAEGQTNRSIIFQTGGERTIFSRHCAKEYRVPDLSESKWLYFTSISKEGLEILPEVYRAIQKNKIKLVFAPGTSQLKAGLGKIALLLRISEILILNKEESKELTQIHSEEPKKLLAALQKLGPKICVMTNGEGGAYAAAGQKYYFAPALKVKVADATGAGDSFAAGFVAAIIYSNGIGEALKWGIANSTANIAVRGGQVGLLDKEQIKEKSKEVEVNLII